VAGYYNGETENEDAFGKGVFLSITWDALSAENLVLWLFKFIRTDFCFVTYFGITDMRKPLKRDVDRQSVRENGESFIVQPHEVQF
jgi:hypothetical protein